MYYLRLSKVTTIAWQCCEQSQTFIIVSFPYLADVPLVMYKMFMLMQFISVDGEYLVSQKTAARFFIMLYTMMPHS